MLARSRSGDLQCPQAVFGFADMILVLGSINLDLVQRVPRLPRPGETIGGEDLRLFVGGKGANQACAAARLGGQVRFAGKTGTDALALRLRAELRDSGVDCCLLSQADGASGTAIILVLPSGENVIVLAPGANGRVDAEFGLAAVEQLAPGDLLLCQLEIPLETVSAALHAAHQRGVRTILDPAPARNLPGEVLEAVSFLTPNQSEAALLAGRQRPVEHMGEAEEMAKLLLQRGAATVIVKMGAQGCLMASKASGQPAITIASGFAVEVVDSTAAGDTFNGALAVALSEQQPLQRALRFANAAAALSVTRAGAISALPDREQVERFLTPQQSR